MPKQNFVAGTTPTIGAVWLNKIDTMFVDAFAEAQTAAGVRSALGATAVGDAIFRAANAAAVRTAAELIAGGAGDIWVEKAGDTMTGGLNLPNVSASSQVGFILSSAFAEFAHSGTTGLVIRTDAPDFYFTADNDTADSGTFHWRRGSALAEIMTLSGGGLVVVGANHKLEYTSDGATGGPILYMARVSASPANGDELGGFTFEGRDSGGNNTGYIRFLTRINDVTNGSEDGQLEIQAQVAGTDTQVLKLNEQGLDWRASSSITPTDNQHVTVEFTNNTTLTFKGKGTDGTVRSATLTLA